MGKSALRRGCWRVHSARIALRRGHEVVVECGQGPLYRDVVLGVAVQFCRCRCRRRNRTCFGGGIDGYRRCRSEKMPWPKRSDKDVVAVAAEEDDIGSGGDEFVVACAADQLIGPATTRQSVIAISTEKGLSLPGLA